MISSPFFRNTSRISVSTSDGSMPRSFTRIPRRYVFSYLSAIWRVRSLIHFDDMTSCISGVNFSWCFAFVIIYPHTRTLSILFLIPAKSNAIKISIVLRIVGLSSEILRSNQLVPHLIRDSYSRSQKTWYPRWVTIFPIISARELIPRPAAQVTRSVKCIVFQYKKIPAIMEKTGGKSKSNYKEIS